MKTLYLVIISIIAGVSLFTIHHVYAPCANDEMSCGDIRPIPNNMLPLQIYRAHFALDRIQCNFNTILVTKSEDHTPACVSTNTALGLILRGWAEQNHDLHQVNVIGTNQTIFYNGVNIVVLGAIKNPSEQRLTLALNTTGKGIISITIPRKLLDLNSSVPKDQFYILSNSGTTNPNETDTDQDRTLVIPIYPQDNQVTISVMSWIQDLARIGLDLHSHPATLDSCDTPFVPKKPDVSPLYPNDTQITTSYTPVFVMPANYTGKLCIHYTNWNMPSQSFINIFKSKNLTKNADVQVSPPHVMIPTGDTDVKFTIKTGNAGFYGIRLVCGGWPFAVGYQSNMSENDFPWVYDRFGCPVITYSTKITGTSGIGIYYIPQVIRSKIDYNITGTSVSSVHLSPSIQNVTFTVHVQTFNDSSKFWFGIKDSDYVKFNGDPKLEEQNSNPCDWTFTNVDAVSDEKQWYKMVGKVTITDRPVTIPPHTNATYSFSILAKDLDAGYYGFNPMYYGVPVDSNIQPENLGGESVANYYPVTMGLDKYLDPSGTCSRK